MVSKRELMASFFFRDRLLLFICHRDPDLFDFGGTVHLLCVATKRHRVLPTPLTM